jgi:hypothetical protein
MTLKSTILRQGDTFFTQFGSSDVQKKYFIDRDPDYFAVVLKIMQARGSALPYKPPKKIHSETLEAELNYFGLSPSIEQLIGAKNNLDELVSDDDMKFLSKMRLEKSIELENQSFYESLGTKRHKYEELAQLVSDSLKKTSLSLDKSFGKIQIIGKFAHDTFYTYLKEYYITLKESYPSSFPKSENEYEFPLLTTNKDLNKNCELRRINIESSLPTDEYPNIICEDSLNFSLFIRFMKLKHKLTLVTRELDYTCFDSMMEMYCDDINYNKLNNNIYQNMKVKNYLV